MSQTRVLILPSSTCRCAEVIRNQWHVTPPSLNVFLTTLSTCCYFRFDLKTNLSERLQTIGAQQSDTTKLSYSVAYARLPFDTHRKATCSDISPKARATHRPTASLPTYRPRIVASCLNPMTKPFSQCEHHSTILNSVGMTSVCSDTQRIELKELPEHYVRA